MESQTDKKGERSCQCLCSTRTVWSIHSHFARPPPETMSFHHSPWFHTPRPNIWADMNRNEKHRIVFQQTIVSSAVICVMLSTPLGLYISGPFVCMPAVFPSARKHDWGQQYSTFSLIGQLLCFSSDNLNCSVLPSGWYITWLANWHCPWSQMPTFIIHILGVTFLEPMFYMLKSVSKNQKIL